MSDKHRDETPPFSIIIPTLDEERFILQSIEGALALSPTEIIICDGGSTDATTEIVRRLRKRHPGLHLLHAVRGRGTQLQAAAGHSVCKLLLFVHADCRLPDNTPALIRTFVERGYEAATFRLKFDAPGFLYRLFELGARFDSPFSRFGDQGLLIRRDLYLRCGGFPPVPLFEDVILFNVIRKLTRLHYLDAPITSSARRFERNGPLRQMWADIRLLLRFYAGSAPDRLAERYERRRF